MKWTEVTKRAQSFICFRGVYGLVLKVDKPSYTAYNNSDNIHAVFLFDCKHSTFKHKLQKKCIQCQCYFEVTMYNDFFILFKVCKI